ncbi:hypothetical protein PULV_a0272 [Pseudoalteromonas ulvae UL12]|uniref:Uncharacterized protein n=1 Tax=Pseudoalteromonas ulvae TaxID=107327 RepID=A0A244CUM3_PSEDV|nr:hypothetical protein [Pseudoalteromonas ulvae]MBE0362724.1 hypothetical protein [Pseudoalteromonas ulvae UL12]OUL59332.1 hypothetical protein B1199_03435 [Pseudoalteromonas ulvae]
MKQEITYEFSDAQVANRFRNELKHWPKAEVKAVLFQNDKRVKVSYYTADDGFDTTCSELDTLAAAYNAAEC